MRSVAIAMPQSLGQAIPRHADPEFFAVDNSPNPSLWITRTEGGIS